jgi:DNA-directed RNA polymerase specialized sigma24 family protein
MGVQEDDEEHGVVVLPEPSYEVDTGLAIDVHRAIERLGGKWRVVAWLIHIEGYTQEDVAVLFGVTHQAVSKILAKVDDELRAQLADYGKDGSA